MAGSINNHNAKSSLGARVFWTSDQNGDPAPMLLQVVTVWLPSSLSDYIGFLRRPHRGRSYKGNICKWDFAVNSHSKRNSTGKALSRQHCALVGTQCAEPLVTYASSFARCHGSIYKPPAALSPLLHRCTGGDLGSAPIGLSEPLQPPPVLLAVP